jgi:hypothetical protein
MQNPRFVEEIKLAGQVVVSAFVAAVSALVLIMQVI